MSIYKCTIVACCNILYRVPFLHAGISKSDAKEEKERSSMALQRVRIVKINNQDNRYLDYNL